MSYEYKILKKPTEAIINEYGADGWRLHLLEVDPRDGEPLYVVMERGIEQPERKTETKGRSK